MIFIGCFSNILGLKPNRFFLNLNTLGMNIVSPVKVYTEFLFSNKKVFL